MRSLIFLSFVALVGCASTSTETASSDDALSDDFPRPYTAPPFTLYVQAPIAVSLGQAIDATKDANAHWSEGSILDAHCVKGDVSSAVEANKALGGTALGQIAMSSVALAPESGPGLESMSPHPSFFVDAAKLPFYGPVYTLREVANYQAALTPNDHAISGDAEAVVQHNSFYVTTAYKTSEGAECGQHWVRGFTSKRFLAYGMKLEFKTAAETEDFRTRYLRINSILTKDEAKRAEISKYLIGHGATLSVHVLVSTGLRDALVAKTVRDVCSIGNLGGCIALNDHLYEAMSQLSSVAGSDDALADLTAVGATWGIYEVDARPYEQAIPATK